MSWAWLRKSPGWKNWEQTEHGENIENEHHKKWHYRKLNTQTEKHRWWQIFAASVVDVKCSGRSKVELITAESFLEEILVMVCLRWSWNTGDLKGLIGGVPPIMTVIQPSPQLHLKFGCSHHQGYKDWVWEFASLVTHRHWNFPSFYFFADSTEHIDLQVIPQSRLIEGDNLTLKCVADGNPAPTSFMFDLKVPKNFIKWLEMPSLCAH